MLVILLPRQCGVIKMTNVQSQAPSEVIFEVPNNTFGL